MQHCKCDVSIIFRDPKDRSTKRQMNTPEPSVMSENVQQFKKKWEKVEIDGRYILNEKVKDELCRLEVHIENGCLC